ncbi:hypothetical protein [Flexivirga alba]|uniref:ABC transporter substrate-binding protein n=1 Tax=Flexivirga alba TaxID=702742 RepID=A0ABW2ADI9_9MICO
MSSVTRMDVAVRRYPHTGALLDGQVTADGLELHFANVEPIHRAFAPMVRELRYDASELAIATLFQAVEAGVPIAALPIVLHGNFHHRSLSALDGAALFPGDLRGRRVGVRSYTQTTGLWVRGILADTYGVAAQDVTWVTNEGPHVASYHEPSNVERTDKELLPLLREGDVDAVLIGARSADHVQELAPLIADSESQQSQFYDANGWIPINHLLVVRKDLLEDNPTAVRALYSGFAAAIDAARPDEPTGSVREIVVQHGITDTLLATLDAALRHAREQELISSDLSAADLFHDFEKYAGE